VGTLTVGQDRLRSTLRRIGSAALVSLTLLLTAGGARADGGNLEYALKATFIYKLAAFVQWPGSAFDSAASPLNLCVVGSNPFGKLLDQAVAGQRIDSHPIVVRHIPVLDKAAGCHIVYVGVSNAESVAQELRSVRGTPVLTVTDAAFENSARGIVHFVIRDSRVRFEINSDAAAQNGVTISSKLKSLAVPSRPNA
jgi:hypothetical protein